MTFREQYKLGQIPPEATKEGPICMDTWRYSRAVVFTGNFMVYSVNSA